MADQPPACAPGGPGVDILGLCLVVDPFLEGILYALPLIFAFLAAALTGKTWRARVRGWLYGARWSTAYAGLLDWLLKGLDRFFGPPHSWRAFERCFALALIYAFGFFWLQGILAASGEENHLPVLIGFSTALPPGIGYYFVFRLIRRGHVRARAAAGSRRRAWLHIREQTLYIALGASCWIVASEFVGPFLGAVVGGFVAPFVGAVAGAVAGGLVAPFVGAVAGAFVGAVAFAAAGAGAGAYAIAVPGTFVSVIVLAIFILLPLINALFDWPSWWVSRWLMGRLREDAQRSSIQGRSIALIGHLALDGVMALLCLFGLAIVVANFAHGVDFPGMWRSYSEARLSPFSGFGAAMTVMMLSTLVPTAIHLFFALFALAVIRPPFAARTAHWLQEDQEGGEIGTQMPVALYLTACAGFALLTLWAAGRLIIWGLNGLVGGAGIWPLIFDTADRFVIF
ncbi:MAG: hypothetical protein AAGF68_09240 [Pseudomonadota bacterium]